MINKDVKDLFSKARMPTWDFDMTASGHARITVDNLTREELSEIVKVVDSLIKIRKMSEKLRK